jgi:hypothetical protein
MEISKEAEPSEFVKSILPILQQNGVVHFLGFGNRLGFDSVPVHLQVAKLASREHLHTLFHRHNKLVHYCIAEAEMQMQLPRSQVRP